MSQAPMKACPYCGESIKATAVKCRFCGEFVDDEEIDAPRRPTRPASSGPEAIEFIIPVNVSGWAMFACYAGLVGMCVPIAGLLFAIPAIVCGIIALVKRPKGVTYGGVTGNVRAILGLIFGTIGVLVWGGLSLMFLMAWLDSRG